MKVFGFYHVGAIGRWKSIFDEQIHKIKNSNLFNITEKIYVGVSGDAGDLNLDAKFAQIGRDENLLNGECITLRHLYEFCQTVEPCHVWYIHTKGASHVNDDAIAKSTESWRKYLEYFIIDQHEACLDLLKKYDVVGTEWRQCVFAGNFWWACSEHIKKLPNPLQNENVEMRYRAECDFITLGRPRMKNILTLIEPSLNGECLYHKQWNPELYKSLVFNGEDFV